MLKTKLIIFDLDGTLTDSLADLTDAVNHIRVLYDKGALSQDEVRGMVGRGARDLVLRALEDQPDSEVDRALGEFLVYNESHLAEKTRLYPGVTDTLRALQQRGLQMAVISNKHEALCRKLLTILGIDSCFEVILGGDSLPERKPSPVPLFKVLELSNCTVDQSIMVGDSINDIAAARAAGIFSVGCRYGYGKIDELKDADVCISNFGELLHMPLLGC